MSTIPLESMLKSNGPLTAQWILEDMLGTARECDVCDGAFGPSVSYFAPNGKIVYFCAFHALECEEYLHYKPTPHDRVEVTADDREEFLDILAYIHWPWGYNFNRGPVGAPSTQLRDPLQTRYINLSSKLIV